MPILNAPTLFPSTRTSSFVYSVVPVIVGLLALVFFRQSVTQTMIVSTALILTGLHLMLGVKPERPGG